MPVRPTLLHHSGPRFFSTVRFVTIWATCRIFWANGLPPPQAKNFPYAYANFSNKLQVNDIPERRKTLILCAPPRIFIKAKRTSSYLAIIIIFSSFILIIISFPEKIHQTTRKYLELMPKQLRDIRMFPSCNFGTFLSCTILSFALRRSDKIKTRGYITTFVKVNKLTSRRSDNQAHQAF